MTGFRNHRITLASVGLALSGALGVTSLQGCGEGGICGPCGSVLEGSVGISGSAQLDGFFSAVGTMGQVTGNIQGEFEANIRGLAAAWNFQIDGAINADVVADLMAHIRGEIRGALGASGGLVIEYAPPACSADVNIAVEASANCEVQAGCDCEVEVDPGNVSVSCEGTCSGECSGECTGSVSCNASAMGGIACEGECSGACELSAGATCEGTCSGTCNGNCSVENSAGECEGECDGECQGSCELSAGASCDGTCHGTCTADASVMVDCGGEPPRCEGSCSADCSGSCQGSATPPSASASCECDAKADCEASASAQADANITCTPPSLAIRFEIAVDGSLNGDLGAEAAFRARIGELRVRGVAILQGFAQMGALITGEVNGEVVFNPAPLVRLRTSVEGLVDVAASGQFDIAPGRIDCVVPALREAVTVVGGLVGETSGTLSAQAMFSVSLFDLAS